MPPFPGIPYGAAPAYCFPIFEGCMYLLFLLCLLHAIKRDVSHVSYLLGGLAFGLLLEYINVIANMGYTYGKFFIMFGHSPLDIPLCIGVGWAIIMYSARLFTDAFRLPLWSSAALDTLLAINIDLSMDTVAYRLHMWHWNWSDTNLNPLTADWFGIPYGNFFGWLCVVFLYSSLSRLLQKSFSAKQRSRNIKLAAVPLLSVLISQIVLFAVLRYIDVYLQNWFGITALHRFIAFSMVLLLLVAWGWRRKKSTPSSIAAITWLVPLCFHVYFFAWLFAGGFYTENRWINIAAVVNLLIGLFIHAFAVRKPVVQTGPVVTINLNPQAQKKHIEL